MKNVTSGVKAVDSGRRFPGGGSLGRREQPGHEPLISRATLAEVPPTGLSFAFSWASRPRGGRRQADDARHAPPSSSELALAVGCLLRGCLANARRGRIGRRPGVHGPLQRPRSRRLGDRVACRIRVAPRRPTGVVGPRRCDRVRWPRLRVSAICAGAVCRRHAPARVSAAEAGGRPLLQLRDRAADGRVRRPPLPGHPTVDPRLRTPAPR